MFDALVTKFDTLQLSNNVNKSKKSGPKKIVSNILTFSSRKVCLTSINMLRRALISRVSSFVPSENHTYLCPKNHLRLSENTKLVIRAPLDPTEDSKVVFDYMMQKFYRQAPIPVSLKLSRNCEETNNFLKKEVDFLLTGGISFSILDSKSNVVKGVALLAPWKKNENYDLINASVKDWHNCSAEIAHEFPEEKRHLIWRTLQFHHIYDLSQNILSLSGKPYVYYIAIVYLDVDIRSANVTWEALSTYFQSEECKDCSFFIQINIKAHDKIVRHGFKDAKLMDEVSYCDEKLILNERQGRAFKAIDHLGSLRFFAQY